MAIYEYTTPRGRKGYMVRSYMTKFGDRVPVKKCFSKKKDAKDFQSKLDLGMENYLLDNLTFGSLYEEYFEAYKIKNKPQSIRREESLFRLQILPFFENAKIKKITSTDYIEWKKQILNKNFSDSYNKALHTAMVSIFNYARRIYNLNKNIPQEVGGFGKRKGKAIMNVWNNDEFNKFIGAVDNEYDRLLFNFLYKTGVRFGELAALTWNDYDGKSVYINKTISKEFCIDGTHYEGTPKTTHSERRVTLSDDIIRDLNNLKAELIDYAYGFNDNWHIFGGVKPVSHTTITRKKNNYCKKAGVKEIKLHAFRHSHVSFLLSNNVPVTNIAARVGHANPQITLSIYSHMLESDIDPAVDVLNNNI